MIARWSLFFRVDQALKFKTSKPDGFFQGFGTYHVVVSYKPKMAGENEKKIERPSNKRLNPINRVSRPVSSQANSYEESSSKVKLNKEAEFPRHVKDSSSKSILNDQTVTEITEKHSISVKVGASLIRFIKGKGGATQKMVEEEMGVTIVLPSSSKEDHVIIEGGSVDSVAKASARIQAIIDEAVKSPSLEYSHFISLPLAIYPELVDKLFEFQNSILGCGDTSVGETGNNDSNEKNSENEEQKLDHGPSVAAELIVDENKERVEVNVTKIPLVSYAQKVSKSSNPSVHLTNMGIEKSIFINPKTFHLTVLMLKLWNKERLALANEVLQSISSQVVNALDNRPISIRLHGLECMRGSLSKARVVYLPVQEINNEGRLLRACQVIIDAFAKAGLVMEKDANHSLKLHATVMNARHRKRVKGIRPLDYFDARAIYKQYGSEDWGEYVIREAHLSQRFAYDDSGYYHRCGSIIFP